MFSLLDCTLVCPYQKINLIQMILDLVCVKCCHSSHQCLQYTIKLRNPKLLSLHFLRSNFCTQPLLPKNFAHAGLVPRQSAAPKQKTAKSRGTEPMMLPEQSMTRHGTHHNVHSTM